jgi:hypothetical protein
VLMSYKFPAWIANVSALITMGLNACFKAGL